MAKAPPHTPGMRNFIDIAMNANSVSASFEGEVYHNSNARFDEFRIDQRRGVYFANEPDHEYGRYTYRCRIKLNHAIVNRSMDNFEIDRHSLIARGFDGRIVDYTEENDLDEGGEMFDYIAFYPEQIEILEVIDNHQNK